MGFFSRLTSAATGDFMGLGSTLNDITGATSSAALQQKYAIQNAAINHAYQKEFAQNAHQWEAEDLKKAGYNPALTATGGSGASASGGGSFGGGGGQSAMNPFDILNSIVGMQNQTSATKSQNNLNDANAALAIAQAKNIPWETKIKLFDAITKRMGVRNDIRESWNIPEGIRKWLKSPKGNPNKKNSNEEKAKAEIRKELEESGDMIPDIFY